MSSDDSSPSLGATVGKLLTGGIFGGDLPGNMDRGLYTTTRLAVEDGVGELLGPIAVWIIVGVTFVIGIEFVAVGAIIMGVPNVGFLIFGAGVTAILGAALAAGYLVLYAQQDGSEVGEEGASRSEE
ncbi:hypothetical protein [Haloglomus litoreum]|uniref:hypothetical protein n=1 Tax=Haloglomus litoreum TaxID=3034026 RepID=UPI0023E8BE19|nr:hypothetical protein [Haloglomus sp. DT116]